MSLENVYASLMPGLSALVGYPIEAQRVRRSAPASARPEWLPDGSLRYELPTFGRGERRTLIILPPPAAGDRFARKLCARFCQELSHWLGPTRGNIRRIRYAAVAGERYFWDSVLVSALNGDRGKCLNTISVLASLRDALTYRYEGSPVSLGVLLSWNWHTTGPLMYSQNAVRLDVAARHNIRDALDSIKALRVLTDGHHSLLVCDSKGLVRSWLALPSRDPGGGDGGSEGTPRAYRHLRSLIVGHDLIFVMHREALYLLAKEEAFKWAAGAWRRLSGVSVAAMLSPVLPADCATLVANLASEMSFQGKGGLIAISRSPQELLSQCSGGLFSHFADAQPIRATEIGFWNCYRFATVDGSLVLRADGTIANVGVILNVPPEHTTDAQGARTAAASFASTSGASIKVSQDGPISVYLDGTLRRLVG